MGSIVALFLAILFLLVSLSISPASKNDLRASCAAHKGVQQVVGTSWENIHGTVYTVCKDGVVQRVK